MSDEFAVENAPRRAKLDKWPVEDIHRSKINPAAYNPRKIDSYAKEKLHGLLSKHGLVDKLTWNRRTGNLVGGHQRLNDIDARERDQNFFVRCIVVDVDLKQEQEMNVALNNQAAAGQTDPELLMALIQQGKDSFDLDNTGFDAMDLQVQFDLDVVIPGNEKLFSAEDQSPAAQAVLAGAQELGGAKIAERQAKEAEKLAKIKEGKKAFREKAHGQDDAEFIAIVVFKDRAELQLFLNATNTEGKYADGARVLSALGITLAGSEPEGAEVADRSTVPESQ